MALRTAAHTAGAVEGDLDARLDAVALWAIQGPGPLDVRTGVVYAPGNPMQVLGTSATSPWAVTVGTGHVVAKKSGTSNGVYYSCNDALVTVALTVPPVSNTRIDTIYAMQQDLAAIVDADGATAAVIGAVIGTGGNGGLGATPTAPPVPVGAVALYSVQILSTATAGTSGAGVTITRLFNWTVPRGVPIPVSSAAERNAITLREDLRVWRLDLHTLEVYNGTAWGSGSVAVNAKLTTNTVSFYLAGTVLLVAPSITGDGVKKFKITVNFYAIVNTGAGDVYEVAIMDATTGIVLAGRYIPMNAGAGNVAGQAITTSDVPAVGGHVYQIVGKRLAGTGTAQLVGAATLPTEITVEQIT